MEITRARKGMRVCDIEIEGEGRREREREREIEKKTRSSCTGELITT